MGRRTYDVQSASASSPTRLCDLRSNSNGGYVANSTAANIVALPARFTSCLLYTSDAADDMQ